MVSPARKDCIVCLSFPPLESPGGPFFSLVKVGEYGGEMTGVALSGWNLGGKEKRKNEKEKSAV